jgi:diguanylate cyclase (GGDEF)-like protein/PAS domain S-box-containing protein
VSTRYLTLLSPVIARETALAIERVLDSGESVSLSQTYYGAQLDTVIYPVKDGADNVTSVAIYSTDVTERMQQAAVDALFSEIDKRILRGHAKQGLFAFICSEVARIFDFPVVWIGRKMPAGAITVWARGAQDEDAVGFFYKLEDIGVRWDNTPLGKGPAGNAIRFGQPQIAHVGDPDFAPWRKAADAHQLRAFLSIPLILRGEIFGNFTLSSRLEDTFDNAVTVRRLTDLASRICVVEERAIDHEQLRLLQTALSAAANGVFITDHNGRIEWLNAAFVAITGYSEAEALGATPRLLRIGKGDSGFFAEMLQSIAEGQAWSGETSEQRKDGTPVILRQTITAIRDDSGEARHFISILEDVTATRAAENSVMRLAHYDYLTSLPNRALFNDRLHNAVARANRSKDVMALMFLDLDHFKSVNDTHGHDVGDLLLQQVAQRLQTCVRASDTLARLAGDEFTILLPAMAAREDVIVVAEKIVAAFVPPFNLGSVTLDGGVSIGIALFPDDATEAAPLLKHADTAMYVAKRRGRNGYAFYSDPANRTTAQ